jgi:hypothetical protein
MHRQKERIITKKRSSLENASLAINQITRKKDSKTYQPVSILFFYSTNHFFTLEGPAPVAKFGLEAPSPRLSLAKLAALFGLTPPMATLRP